MENLIVAFHIGRGGRFHNAGHKNFIGEKNFQDLINHESNNLFEKDRDEKGRFVKPYLVDGNGNGVSEDDVNALTGTLDFDGQFDTSIAKKIADCTEQEIELIAKDTQQYKSPELVNFLEAYNEDWKFDKYGQPLEKEEV